MPEQKRYNKLKTESKLLMNVIKMIAYRALYKTVHPQ